MPNINSEREREREREALTELIYSEHLFAKTPINDYNNFD